MDGAPQDPSVMRISLATAASLLFLGVTTSGASAPALSVEPAASARYQLALASSDAHVARRAGSRAPGAGDRVDLRYDALVTVLELAPDGRPLRERHTGAQLVALRPADGEAAAAALFAPGTELEVRYAAGDAQVFVAGERLHRGAERVLSDLLASRTAAPALEQLLGDTLERAAQQQPGDGWALDPEACKRFLHARGLRAIEIGDHASARRLPSTGGASDETLRLHFAIPVRWHDPGVEAANLAVGGTEAVFEGTLNAPARGPVTLHTTWRATSAGTTYGERSPNRQRWTLQQRRSVTQTVLDLSPPPRETLAAR